MIHENFLKMRMNCKGLRQQEGGVKSRGQHTSSTLQDKNLM